MGLTKTNPGGESGGFPAVDLDLVRRPPAPGPVGGEAGDAVVER